MGSWTFLLFCVLIILIIINFVAQTVPYLTTGSSFNLACVSDMLPSLLFYFLVPQDVPGSSCTFPGSVLESTILTGVLISFMREWYVETKF